MKRLIVVLFSLVFIITFVPKQVFAENDVNEWSGEIDAPQKRISVDGVYYYQISKPEELAYIAQTGGAWLGYNYILTNDIVLNLEELTYDENGNITVDVADLNEWAPINDFKGIFNGNGFSISGVYVNTDSDAGFFIDFRGDLYNLSIENAYIKGGSSVGGICDYSGKTGAELENCYFDGAIVGRRNVGGLFGETSYSYIKNCGNYGDIWAEEDYVGGISGEQNGYDIENCFNEGNIYSTGNYVGGITGAFDICGVYDCVNKGNITGNRFVSGICGYARYISVQNCGNIGDITGSEYIGGLVGYNGGDIRDTSINTGYNAGIISGTDYVGGIIGYATCCNMSDNYSVGNVVGTTNVGAIAGYSDTIWGKGTASNCYYLKKDTLNASLNGFGNDDDLENGTANKEESFFCMNADRTINVSGHICTNASNLVCLMCGVEETVKEISIGEKPSKLSYVQFKDELNVSGGTIHIIFEDGAQAIYKLSEDMVSGFDNTKLGKQTLTVTYGNQTVTFIVTIRKENNDNFLNIGYESSDNFLSTGECYITNFDLENRTAAYARPVNLKASTVVIPETVDVYGDTYKITDIVANAFRKNRYIKRIIIGENIKSIGNYAFYSCKNLKIITIKTNELKVSKVGKNAFKNIKANATINVPKKKFKAYKKMLIKRGVSKKAYFSKK